MTVAMLPPLAMNAWMRYDAIRRAFRSVPRGASVLEIGVGQGALAARLARHYRYTGCEPDPHSAGVARPRIETRGGRFIQGYDSDVPTEERFDAVGAFEVLEHLEDDAAALARWTGRLRAGGWLILSVPAFQSRFAAHDRKAGHYRRYDPDVLRVRLQDAGLTDVKFWVTGFPLGALLEHGRNALAALGPKEATLETRTLQSGRLLQPPPALALVTAALTFPFRYLQRPFEHTALGTGLVVRARRPPNS